jgi:class 3 adenylate cyclase/tetratricopeptide (TPR) repeat protein
MAGNSDKMGNPFAPYLPRLARELAAVRDGSDAPAVQTLDGTLVSVDISGFTSLSERLAAKGRAGAEELILLISGVFEGLIRIASRRGGDVLKFRGDALLLLYTGEGHEERACRAAAEMRWLLARTGTTVSSAGSVSLRMATGIYTGPCSFFLVGSTHRELVVTGPAATATMRMESAALADEIVAGPATVRALDPDWVVAEREAAFLLHPPVEPEEGDPRPIDLDRDGRLEDFVPAPLRAPLALETVEAEHRQVAVAFLKFSGVDDAIQTAGPDAVLPALQELGTLVGETAAEFGITWLESDIDADGGKLYLVSGAPASAGDNEERLLRAMRRILDAEPTLVVRAGVNRGHAFAGEIGSESRRTYAVMGDTVNLAARLVGRARPGEILATGAVLDRSRARFETEQQPFLMKGKERAVTAFRVGELLGIRELPAAERLPRVDREGEVEQLREAVDQARRRISTHVELVGDPGIGKSTLVDELRTMAVGFTQLHVNCEQYATSTPYFAFRSVLRPLAGITPEQSAREAGEQLAPWIQAVMPDLAELLPLLAIAFDAEVPSTAAAEQVGASFRRTRVHELVEQFMQRVLMMPTLLTFEDTHWLDDASEQLLHHLAGKAGPQPWLICTSRRPHGRPFTNGGTRIVLEPLGAEDAAELALVAAREAPLSSELLEAVVDRSGGNPLFVRELVAASASRGNADALPETVESLLTSRIDALDPGDRLLLRYAAVVGESFDLGLLGEIFAKERIDSSDLERWARLSEFVAWDGPDVLRFRHGLVRAAAYEGLSFKRRRQIHGRIAEALERRAGDGADEIADLLSLHFFHAERWREAWDYAVAAGRRAQEKYANVVSAELYERALAAAEHLPEPDPCLLAAVREALGDVCELFADFTRAEASYVTARELSVEPLMQARLLLKEGVVRERTGRYQEALEQYELGLDTIASDESAAAAAVRVELELAFAGVRHRQGRDEEAIDLGLRAVGHAVSAGDRRGLAHAYSLLDLAYTTLGRPQHEFRERALPIYQEIGDLVGQANVLNNLGIGAYYEGRWGEALRWYRESGEVSRRAGDVVSNARAMSNVAEILCDQGQLEEAEHMLVEAVRIWRAARYSGGIAFATSSLGRVAARGGRFDAALEHLEAAVDAFRELGAESQLLDAQANAAECFVLAGRYQEALELLPTLAVDADRLGGHRALSSRVERLHGYALHQARRPEEARSRFEQALAHARESSATYELALTLKALADTSAPEHERESRALLESLGVVRTPSPPLP